VSRTKASRPTKSPVLKKLLAYSERGAHEEAVHRAMAGADAREAERVAAAGGGVFAEALVQEAELSKEGHRVGVGQRRQAAEEGVQLGDAGAYSVASVGAGVLQGDAREVDGDGAAYGRVQRRVLGAVAHELQGAVQDGLRLVVAPELEEDVGE
jgi:hypothetical protein